MIFVLDNYDSFTYNLVQAVGKLGAQVVVRRNDAITPDALLALDPDGVILSPGPGRPEDAGNMPEILAAVAGRIPLLGVCLGHQMIGLHFGGEVVAAGMLVHGKAAKVFHDNRTIYRGLSDPFAAGRYHSLAVRESSLPACLEISARAEDGEVMGLRHRELPIEGVQFHPESVLTPEGEKVIANFLGWVATLRKITC
ncbi:aminodeoxychorismate/anthranilate synthase component II [candidate division KSB1 bacterium]|nr:aminodeoxychorismate/anthranilate synthase component II [candidate division KSB1 bacterium]